jgi:hypothetical protein
MKLFAHPPLRFYERRSHEQNFLATASTWVANAGTFKADEKRWNRSFQMLSLRGWQGEAACPTRQSWLDGYTTISRGITTAGV